MSDIQTIKDRIDIVDFIGGYVKLNKAGMNFKGLCPFHNEKSGSFIVSEDKQIWHCFGCNSGGDLIEFMQKMEGLEFTEALNVLADRAGVQLTKRGRSDTSKKGKVLDINELACKYFEKALQKTEGGKKAMKYLKERGVNEESIKRFRLGYAPNNWEGVIKFLRKAHFKNKDIMDSGVIVDSPRGGYDRFRARIMFPIFSVASQVIGFTGRTLINEDAKYINTPQTSAYDKSKAIFGLSQAKNSIIKEDSVIVVEGNMDVVMSYQAKVLNTVATSGTSLTEGHLSILKRYTKNLVFCFDSDEAGIEAVKRAIILGLKQGFNIKVILLEDKTQKDYSSAKDPADIILNKGSEKWQQLVKNPLSVFDFLWDINVKDKDLNDIEVKKQIVQNLFDVLQNIINKIEITHWKKEMIKRLDIRENDLEEEWEKLAKKEKLGYNNSDNKNNIDIKQENIVKDRITIDKQNMVSLFFAYPALFKKTDIEKKVLEFSKEISISEDELKLRAEVIWPEKGLAKKELERIVRDWDNLEQKQKAIQELGD